MLSKVKQFNDLRKQANTLKSAMSEESVTIDNKGIKIVMDGNQEIKTLEINEEYLSPSKKKDLEKYIKNAMADALKKIQRKMAMKMQKMDNFNIPGM